MVVVVVVVGLTVQREQRRLPTRFTRSPASCSLLLLDSAIVDRGGRGKLSGATHFTRLLSSVALDPSKGGPQLTNYCVHVPGPNSERRDIACMTDPTPSTSPS